MSRSLFNITEDMLALERILHEAGGDISDPQVEAAVNEWFDELQGDLESKVENYCSLIKDIEVRAANRKREEERIRRLRQVDENMVKSLKSRMQQALDFVGVPRVNTDLFRVTVANNGGKQPMVVNEAAIPPEYITTRMIDEPNKDLIRQHLEDGQDLPFAQLKERGRSLRIA